MSRESKIKALSKVGAILKSVGDNSPWTGFEMGITESEYNDFADLVYRVKVFNGWFEESEVRRAFRSWGEALTEDNLNQWLVRYDEAANSSWIAIIMAGNIPMVGFHDLISVYLSGHHALVKLSSDDDKLIPAVVHLLKNFDDEVENCIKFSSAKLEGFEAVIATGSNNSARYFEQYFGGYPNIIRKNRTSVAVINGDESEEELKSLADDVFAYFGLGCRNVTKLLLPKGYSLDHIFRALFHYQDVVNNKKYGNNYDYHKSIFLLEGYDVLENGFLLMKRDEALVSPIGTLFYDYYDSVKAVEEHLISNQDKIQCVVGKNYIPFGQAQNPQLWDYADGVDTLKFLVAL